MAESRMREDIQSAYLSINEFMGQSLTGPRELITRKVLCSNPQTLTSIDEAINVANGPGERVRAKDATFNQLNFRVLSTSPGALLNAKVELVCPMIFHHVYCGTPAQAVNKQYYHTQGGDSATLVPGLTTTQVGGQFAPRRNGLLKACRTISSTVNSTVSFSFRPNEGLDVMEQIFTQEGVAGQTGVYNEAEAGTWGNNDGLYLGGTRANGVLVHADNPIQGVQAVRNWFSGVEQPSDVSAAGIPNKGFIDRRADFRTGGGADPPRGVPGVSTWIRDGNAVNYCQYDYRTTLSIPPFKTFQKDIYCRTPSWIPYADSIDLMLNFKNAAEIKAALMQAPSVGEVASSLGQAAVGTMLQDYSVGFYAQPYLNVEWCVPPVALRPSYTLPCWRNQHYSQRVSWAANNDDKKPVTFQGIRLDSLPSLISVHVTDIAADKTMNGTNTAWAAKGYNWTEFFGPVTEFAVTLNEKLSVLSDKSTYDLYKLYRMYAPDSKMSFTVWRELRQVILIRSDVLAVEKGQSVFNPTNLTLNMNVQKAVPFRHDASMRIADGSVPHCIAKDMEVHVNFFYFNDALTLSQQAAAVTSMLLSPSDVQQLRISPESKEIQTLMEMGLQG